MMKAYHPAFPAEPLLFYKLFPVPDPPNQVHFPTISFLYEV